MGAFIKRMIASMLGVLLGGLILFFVSFMILAVIVNKMESWAVQPVEKDSLLVLKIEGPLVEGTGEQFRDFLSNWADPKMQPTGLYEINEALKVAKDDDRIKGLYLSFDKLSGGWATLQSLRRSIEDFKSSGKPVVAYFEVPNLATYYVASVATELYFYPESTLDLSGLASVQPFFKGFFDKWDIEPRIFRVGTHKGLAEPFTRKDLSPENRAQIQQILNGFWTTFLADVRASRPDMTVRLEELPKDEPLLSADQVLSYGLVDGLVSKEGALASFPFLKEKWEEKNKQFVSLRRYLLELNGIDGKNGDGVSKVALIFAEGEVVYGDGSAYESIGSEQFVRSLRELYQDEEIKAIVVRVNSGGGSALASDIIWRKLNDRPENLPLVTSVGDMAASGAYYFIASSNHIYAEPTSITGSIGVIGILFDIHQFFNKSLGVSFDQVKTHPYADLASPLRELSEKEAREIQDSIEETYEQFITVVQKGRRFPDLESVNQVAQGKIYTGMKGMELGLVDEMGGLDQAIQKAAELAKLTEYEVKVVQVYPQDFEALLQKWLSPFSKALFPGWFAQSELMLKSEKLHRKLESHQGVITRIPFDF